MSLATSMTVVISKGDFVTMMIYKYKSPRINQSRHFDTTVAKIKYLPTVRVRNLLPVPRSLCSFDCEGGVFINCDVVWRLGRYYSACCPDGHYFDHKPLILIFISVLGSSNKYHSINSLIVMSCDVLVDTIVNVALMAIILTTSLLS